jgi:predicted ATPase
MVSRPVIRTPDQKLRVFVSSTLRELAEERRAARSAIERMHLAPVMFELGARPHPPRELYRSYLEQSDVFVGIYWESYGWVAPDEDVSGLEDEYNLAPASMPKLIYIKASAQRDDRLKELIARIQADDTAAYLPFETAEELEQRLFDDLATMLAERFDESRAPTPVESASASLASRVPVPYTTTIGRDQDIARVRELLRGGDHRVISLIGPGGIGKSRLAIEVAYATEDLFPDGTYFVALEGVLESKLLLPTIAYSLGIRDNGEAALEERISHALAGRRVLLVLDNFEQIVDAAPVLVRLYTVAPEACFLVTSRVVLRIRGEQVYEVEALTTPAGDTTTSLDRAARSTAVALFVDRAEAAKPGFVLNEENAADIVDICRRLEGLPLAIELAAAKSRLLTPRGIAERLQQSLPLLTAAVRDLPERHRTMRATIEWSVSLLSDEHRAMLEDLGVFARQFTLEAVEALGRGRVWDGDAIDGIAALIDGSLVKQSEVRGRPVLALLAIVREYALGRLKERGEADLMRRAHADYYLAFVHRHAPHLRGEGQVEAVTELGLELPNLRAAARHLVYTNRLDDAGDFAWSMLIYWWIAGFFAEVRVWMLELLDKQQPITQHTRAVAWFFTLWGELWQHPSEEAIAGLAECVRLFHESGDDDASAMTLAARATARVMFPNPDLSRADAELTQAIEKLHELGNGWAEAITEVSRGRLAWVQGRLDDALEHFDRATEIAEAGGDVFTQSIAGNQRGRMQFMRGDLDAAAETFTRTLLLSIRLHHDEGVAYGLEGLCAVAAANGQAWRAGALYAAAAAIRHRIGFFDVAAFVVHTARLEQLRKTEGDAVAAGERVGAELSIAEAVALALPEAAQAEIHESLVNW